MRRAFRVSVMVVVALAAACGDSGGDLSVADPWARASAGVQNAGAVYMMIEGGDEADTLTGVSVSPDVAAMAQIHETTMNDEGAMMMSEVNGIPVPAGGSVELAPGGFHVMLMNLAEPLQTGTTFDVTLTFAGAGDVTVTAEVRDG